MICLFNSTASKSDLIQTNGDYIFDGVFRISNTFPKALYDMLTEESILKVEEEYGKEYFRIAKVIKSPKNITVFARHITISDILTLWCEDVRPTGLNGAGAITWIYDNSIGNKLLTVNSDITDTNTSYFQNKNVYECLFTADNSFLDRWGGEVYRRGFNLAINKKVGQDRGVTIRSKKNLTGFEANTTVDSLITRIYPKGYDGITIDEKYIDSEYINNYARIYTSEQKFEDVKVNSESVDDGFETLASAQEELKRRVQQMYEVDKVDLLTATYTINFVELGKTEEYKNYSILEQTWLGDTVEVIEDTLGVNISVRVLKRKYDVIKKKRLETELSNKDIKKKPPTIQQIVNELEKIHENRFEIITGKSVTEFCGDAEGISTVEVNSGEIYDADLAIICTGVRPNVELAVDAGIKLGVTGAIRVNRRMETSEPDIYACGDCCEEIQIITQAPVWMPLGSNANKEGRCAAINCCGGRDEFFGVLSSAVTRCLGLTISMTGLNEKDARKAGFDPVSATVTKYDKVGYMPDANNITLKIVADKRSGKLLGGQAIGAGDSDKRINTLATALLAGLTVDEFRRNDMTYAPPFSTTIDLLINASEILLEKISGK